MALLIHRMGGVAAEPIRYVLVIWVWFIKPGSRLKSELHFTSKQDYRYIHTTEFNSLLSCDVSGPKAATFRHVHIVIYHRLNRIGFTHPRGLRLVSNDQLWGFRWWSALALPISLLVTFTRTIV